MSKCLGYKTIDGFAAGVLVVISTFPPYSFDFYSSWLFVSMQMASSVSLVVLTTSLFIAVGRKTFFVSLVSAILIQVLIAYYFITTIILVPTAAIYIASVIIVGFSCIETRKELIAKSACILGTLFLFFVPMLYLAAKYMSTNVYQFGSDFAASYVALPNDIFSLMHFLMPYSLSISPTPIKCIVIIVTFYAIYLLSYNKIYRSKIRIDAAILVCWVSIFLVQRLFSPRFPIMGTFSAFADMYVIPIFCLQLWRLSKLLILPRIVSISNISVVASFSRSLKRADLMALSLLIAAVSFANITNILDRSKWKELWPPMENDIIDYLRDKIGLAKNSGFQGRVVNMAGLELKNSINWGELVAKYDSPLINIVGHTGNDYRTAGFRYYLIPNLFEYSDYVSEAYHVFTTRLLGYPDDVFPHNVQILRKFEPRILRLLGVRFVVTDALLAAPQTSLRVSLTMPAKGIDAFHLYELDSPNLGNYSPTRIVINSNATTILHWLADPFFDPSGTAILSVGENVGALIAASTAELIFEGSSLRIRAHSDARSLLLLPLQFSNCLASEALEGSAPARLLRADLLLTGVLFSGDLDARIALNTGPFVNPLCRLDDVADDKLMGIGQVPKRL
jgi:hypothetical protein